MMNRLFFKFKYILSLFVILANWFVFSLLDVTNTNAQSSYIDSLIKVTENKSIHDTIRLKALFKWDDEIYLYDQEADQRINEKVIQLSENCLTKNRGKKTTDFCLLCKAKAMNNLGMLFFEKGNYKKAIELHSESLRMNEKLNDPYSTSITLGNIANIYYELHEYNKALEYYNKSRIQGAKAKNKYLESISLNNIANIYADLKKSDKAFTSYRQSLTIAISIPDSAGIARALNNIGSIHIDLKNYDSAYFYNQMAYKIRKSIHDDKGIASSAGELGLLLLTKNKYAEALVILKEAESYATKTNSISILRDLSESMYVCYKNMGDFTNSLIYHEKFMKYKDSIINDENSRASIKREYKYDYEKQSEAVRIKSQQQKKIDEAKLKESEARIAQKETLEYALYGGLILVIGFLLFVYNRYKVVHKQKEIIEIKEKETHYQKELIQEKQREIIDSISYAKRIQDAILPSEMDWNKNLKNSFVLYQPKDIIAGDFYWMEKVENHLFFAVADCTGHGVPGALVSVVCSTALTKCILEYKLTDAGKILDMTRNIVIRQFEKASDTVRDGMDISLCCCKVENGKIKNLQWAGANNPLIIIRAGQKLEWEANKEPIGKYENSNPFTTHFIECETNDMLFLFSDGYADQFGGPLKKKFRKNNLYSLFIEIGNLDCALQKQTLINRFKDWKGLAEQIDDVCVVGIRV